MTNKHPNQAQSPGAQPGKRISDERNDPEQQDGATQGMAPLHQEIPDPPRKSEHDDEPGAS